MKLLIVEDDTIQLTGLKHMIEYEYPDSVIYTASNSNDAVSVINSCSIDLFMLDIKHINDEEHKKLTGQTNKNILDMAQYLSDNGKKMWIRHVLVPGITDDEKYLRQLKEFVDTLKTVDRVEVLPYHTLGVFKWKELGLKYQLEGIQPPDAESIAKAKEILASRQ